MNYSISEKDLEYLNKCPGCNSNNLHEINKVFSKKDEIHFFSTSYCSSCSLVFRGVRPSLDWFTRKWEIRYNFQKKNKINFINESIENERYWRYLNTCNTLEKIISFNKVLDVGCGTGTGMKAFIEKNKTITGIEPDTSRADYGINLGLDIIKLSIEDYYLKNSKSNKFDLLISLHSLEHLHDAKRVLSIFKNLIKNDGYIFIEVPDFMNYVEDINDSLYLGHLYNFSIYSLCKMAEEIGLFPSHAVFPYSRPCSEKNLGILFNKKEKKINYDFLEKPSKKEVFSKYLSKYKFLENITTEIHVEEINDLSMCWKPIKKVSNTIQDTNRSRDFFQNGKNIIEVNSTKTFNEIKIIEKPFVKLNEILQPLILELA